MRQTTKDWRSAVAEGNWSDPVGLVPIPAAKVGRVFDPAAGSACKGAERPLLIFARRLLPSLA